MAVAKGFQGIVGVKKAAVWGTAVACGANDGIEVLNAGVVANRGRVMDQSITGRVTQRKSDKGNIAVNGPLLAPLRYEGRVLSLVAALFGTAGVPTTVDTSGKKHVFKIADSVDGIFYTLAYEILKDTTIYEFNTLKIVGLTVRVQIPGRVTVELRTIGHDFTDASATNTTTTIDTLTQPAYAEIAQARQLIARINTQSGAGLGAGDARHVTAFELNIERNLQAEYTSEFGDRSSEPMPPSGDDPFLKVTGSYTFSQAKNGTGGNLEFVMKQLQKETQKSDIQLIGDNLAGAATEKYAHRLYLPEITFGDGKPVLSAGALGWQVPFEAAHVGAIPTGFPTGYVDAVTWETVNTHAADYLA